MNRFHRNAVGIAPVLVALGCATADPYNARSRALDPDDPRLALVREFFEAPTFPNKAERYTGEMLHFVDGQSFGEMTPPGYERSYRLLVDEPDKAVLGVAVHGDGGFYGDWYCFLRREDNAWKIEASRTLTLPVDFLMRYEDLAAKDLRTPDEEAAYLGLELATRSDAGRARHWREHNAEFAELVRLFRESGADVVWADSEEAAADFAELQARASTLGINALFRREAYPGCVFLYIGGVSTDEIGYIHAPENATPPPIAPAPFILVEPIGQGWYIYKTT